jgi:ABC-type antimicrobial peptide transport system permease subunit
LFALLLGCLLAQLALPFLRQLMEKPVSLGQLYAPSLIIFLVTIWAAIVILAGFYPAIVLAGFNPIAAIKSKITPRTIGGVSLRKGLVVFQFVIAQLLIVGTVVVVRQMHLFSHRPLGFEKAATAYVELPSDSADRTKYGYLKQQLSGVPGVTNTSLCMDVPSSNMTLEQEFFFDNNPVKGDFKVTMQMADTDYLATFHIGLVAGRLPYQRDTDAGELLVNETMIKKLGLHSPDQILGKPMAVNNPGWKFRIVGVIHDYNSQSLHNAITPLIMAPVAGAYNYIALRLEPQRMKSTLEQVQKKFTGIYPSYIYDCKFLDESIAHFYLTEGITAELVRWAAALAIFISCLGLYGLVSFMAVQKTKEVGVRKVLGASITNILLLFSREFTILPLIAFLVAAPLGYYFAHRWLSGFYYHVELSWDIFFLALTLSLAIAWLTVGYKAMRAARANPVKSLRTE